MPKNARKSKRARHAGRKPAREEERSGEDPFLLDDPGGSPFEWLELRHGPLHEAVRRKPVPDPWTRSGLAWQSECFTERRRRKLQIQSLCAEDERPGENGASAA